jgi:hypothetical protein
VFAVHDHQHQRGHLSEEQGENDDEKLCV